MPRCKACLHKLRSCGGEVNSIEDTAIDPCSMQIQEIVQMLQWRQPLELEAVEFQQLSHQVKQ